MLNVSLVIDALVRFNAKRLEILNSACRRGIYAMPNHMALRSQIAKLFLEELHLDVPSPDSDLMEAGILDSLAFVDLLMGLEREFEIDIAFDSIEADNFRSLSKIAEFVGEHRATKMEASVNEVQHCQTM